MAQKFYLFARVSTSQLQLLFININNLSAKEDNAVRLGGYNQIKISDCEICMEFILYTLIIIFKLPFNIKIQ